MSSMVNICDVCTDIFAGGDAPKGRISSIRTEQYPIPIYSNGEDKAGLYGYTDTARVYAQSVTVSARGTIGYTAIRTEPFVPIVRLITLVPDQSKIDIKYLYYAVQNYEFEGSGTSIPQLTVPMLKKYNFPLPSKEEQQKVVSALDKVNELISLRKEQLAKLDQLVKSRFIEQFGDPVSNPLGWEKKSLKEVCIKLNDGTHFSPESFETGEYKYVTAKNIKMSGFDFTNITYVPEEVHRPIYERCNPELGDVLYIKDGVTTGIAMVNTLDEEFTLLSSVALLKQDRRIMNGYFLTALLNNENMYTDIRSNMGGAAIARLTIAKLTGIQIILPPMELQNQFAAFVEQTDKSKLAIQQSLDNLELLKNSLMQEYFG